METIGTKICSKCGKRKSFDSFYKNKTSKDGYNVWCKNCLIEYNRQTREQRRSYNQTYYAEHKGKEVAERRKYEEEHKDEIACLKQIKIQEWREAHKEQKRAYDKNYYTEHKEQRKAYLRAYKLKNPDKEKIWAENYKERKNARRLSNPKLRLDRIFDSVVWSVLSGRNISNSRITEFVSYNSTELRQYLEQQFTSEMTWDNYGSYWELDHIIPRKLFNYSDSSDEDFQKCWALSNLRPLEVSANRQRPRDGSDIL